MCALSMFSRLPSLTHLWNANHLDPTSHVAHGLHGGVSSTLAYSRTLLQETRVHINLQASLHLHT